MATPAGIKESENQDSAGTMSIFLSQRIQVHMKTFLILLTIGILGWGLYAIRAANQWDKDHPCIRSHMEMRHQPAWTQFITTSYKPLIMVPIYHPAYDYQAEVCDERK